MAHGEPAKQGARDMAIKNVEIGATYFSGSAYSPEEKTVVAILDWSAVPAKSQKSWQTITYWQDMSTSGIQWVKYRSSKYRGVQYMPADVFVGVCHVSHDAMIESYVAGRRAIGLSA